MSDQGELLAEIINLGFDWVRARNNFRRAVDSRSATEADRKKAGRLALETGNKLEKAFLDLMKASNGAPARRTRRPIPVDWGKVAGAIAKGAGAIESALSSNRPVVEVIDTEGKEV